MPGWAVQQVHNFWHSFFAVWDDHFSMVRAAKNFATFGGLVVRTEQIFFVLFFLGCVLGLTPGSPNGQHFLVPIGGTEFHLIIFGYW